MEYIHQVFVYKTTYLKFKIVHNVYVRIITCITTNSYTILKYNVTNVIKLPTCFVVTAHHPEGRHTEQLKMHKPSSLGIH
jgi:hypothetical protein